MSSTARAGYARRRLKGKMPNRCVVRQQYNGTIVYDEKCRVVVAQASQGQLSEPDPVEGDVSAYASWRIFFPYPEASGILLEGQEITTSDPITNDSMKIIIVAVENITSDQVNLEARAVKQRTGVPSEEITLYRLDDNGTEILVTTQLVQVVLDSPTPLGASPEGSGGNASYISGTLIFYDENVNVKVGYYFRYQGRFGEVTGIPVRAFDRTEARMRVSASHL